jgi:hypothetical protein
MRIINWIFQLMVSLVMYTAYGILFVTVPRLSGVMLGWIIIHKRYRASLGD